jgi:hypothetical protein
MPKPFPRDSFSFDADQYRVNIEEAIAFAPVVASEVARHHSRPLELVPLGEEKWFGS